MLLRQWYLGALSRCSCLTDLFSDVGSVNVTRIVYTTHVNAYAQSPRHLLKTGRQ